MNDERHWNINLLNKWFAISSIIFMVSFIWMFIDDNDDAFKKYQRAFRKMEVETAEKKLQIEINKVKEERISYDQKLAQAKQNFDSKNLELEEVFVKILIYNQKWVEKVDFFYPQ